MNESVQKPITLNRRYLDDEGQEDSVQLLQQSGSSHADVEKVSSISMQERTWQVYSSKIKAVIVSAVESLRPQFPGKEETCGLRSTAWLDGLRGVAALMVVFQHMEVAWFWEFYNQVRGGTKIDAGNNWFVWILLQSPFTLIWKGGPIWVNIFFVISGYSLSYKPLSLLGSNSPSKCRETLTSSVFRRPMRLFLPTVFSTFLAMLCVHSQLWTDHYPWWITPPPHFDNLFDQLQHWLAFAVVDPMDPFRTATGNLYDGNLWTIPVEFYGSIIVFILLLAISSSIRSVRYFVLVTFALLAIHGGHDIVFVFTSGSILAETHLLLTKYPPLEFLEDRNIITSMRAQNLLGTIANVFWTIIFIMCLWSAGFTNDTLSTGSNPHQIESYIIAMTPVFILAVNNSYTLQSFFTSRPSIFLARISFSLYLVHGMIIRIIAWTYIPLFQNIWGVVINEEKNRWDGRKDVAYTGAMSCTGLVTLGLCLLCADWFERAIDRRSVNFAGSVFAWCEERRDEDMEKIPRGRLP